MLIGGFCAVMMNVLIRFAAYRLHPFEVTFFRCLFSLFVMLPFIIRSGPSILATPKVGFYTLRAVVGLISMLSWFYGITIVPLATATAVNFTAPLFATMAAALILHEDVRLRRWIAVVIGFVGVLVIMRPGRESLDAMLLLILLSAASSAMNNITVKYLVRTERPNTIVALFSVYLTPLSLIPALFVWEWPDLKSLGALVGLGVIGTLSHLSVARAYLAADASACAPYEFVRLPYAALIGYLLFGEVSDGWTWVGAAIIAGAATAKEVGGFAVRCDVTNAADTEQAVAAARERHGPARLAIACAGIGTAGRIVGRDGPLPLDEFRRTVEVNLIGSFNLLRLAAADLTALDPLGDGERGLIVLTASVAAYEGQIGQAAYSASKGGIVGLTLPAARELARYGVRVVAIAPGIFATPMLAGLPQNVQDSLGASVPFPPRLGRPEEYAQLVLDLCRNVMINGSVVRLDGALRMAPR